MRVAIAGVGVAGGWYAEIVRGLEFVQAAYASARSSRIIETI